jgi:SAM-dependent methyltransferase
LRIAVRSLAAVFVLAAAAAWAQGDPGSFEPRVGQPGKDVVWVPTPEALVDKMLEMARTTSADYVVDLGSGDGRIAIAAARKFGARSMGVEFDGDMVALSRKNAADAGVADRARFVQADIFQTDFRDATVVTMYLLPSLNIRLQPTLLAMRPGTRIVSHRFNMGDWEPDQTVWADERQAYLWIVPANVEGTWQMTLEGPKGPIRYDLRLRQQFQKVEGEIKRGIDAKLFEAKMTADMIAFILAENGTSRVFVGQVAGTEMSGWARTEGLPELRWRAKRL